jgi:hypothetical protein
MRLGVLVSLTVIWTGLVLWLAPWALVCALPWIAATLWVAWRSGWQVLRGDAEGDIESQSKKLRGFGGTG